MVFKFTYKETKGVLRVKISLEVSTTIKTIPRRSIH